MFVGDDLLEKLLKEQEELNMDMVYEVMDFYKNAILLGREMEVIHLLMQARLSFKLHYTLFAHDLISDLIRTSDEIKLLT